MRVHLHTLSGWLAILTPSGRRARVVVSRDKSGVRVGRRVQVGVLEGDGGGGHPGQDVVGVGAVREGGVGGSDVRAV